VHLGSEAQFIPNNGQAFQFMPLYNPAFTGIESYADLKLSYRYQWTGFGADAPKFMNLSFTTRLKQPMDLRYHALRAGNPTAADAQNYPKSKTIIHGLGINVLHETFGQVKRAGVGVQYGFHYALTRRARLALGVGVTYDSKTIDINKITVWGNDPYYDHLASVGANTSTLNGRVGALVYSDRFYLGVSYLKAFNTVLQSPTADEETPVYMGTAEAGVSLPMTPDFVLRPSVLVLIPVDNELQIDYNLKAYIQQRLWIGASYRAVETLVAMAGFHINDNLSASYSYETSLNGFKQFSDGSHELVVGIRLNNFKRQNPFVW
jgi:type IX secretion system PorP/SprF family membrane protein